MISDFLDLPMLDIFAYTHLYHILLVQLFKILITVWTSHHFDDISRCKLVHQNLQIFFFLVSFRIPNTKHISFLDLDYLDTVLCTMLLLLDYCLDLRLVRLWMLGYTQSTSEYLFQYFLFLIEVLLVCDLWTFKYGICNDKAATMRNGFTVPGW